MGGRGWFGRRPSTPDEIVATNAIKDWIRIHCALPEDTVIAVNEIVCSDVSCPGIETVMLIMAPGRKTTAHKIGKALIDVTESDLSLTLKAPNA
jgi:hypothetical protein